MKEELEGMSSFEYSNEGGQGDLPNSTAVLVLGILSIVGCFCYGIVGLVLGIIALVLHKKDKALYDSDPTKYGASFKNSKAGNICAIVGLILSIIYVLFFIAYIVFIIPMILDGGRGVNPFDFYQSNF
jgi:uncharacterized protein YqhQ